MGGCGLHQSGLFDLRACLAVYGKAMSVILADVPQPQHVEYGFLNLVAHLVDPATRTLQVRGHLIDLFGEWEGLCVRSALWFQAAFVNSSDMSFLIT